MKHLKLLPSPSIDMHRGNRCVHAAVMFYILAILVKHMIRIY